MISTTADAADVRVGDAAAPPLPSGSDPRSRASSTASTDGPRTFLPLPPPLEPRARRGHQIVLACLMLFGLAQGAYWAVTTVAWNPIDEVAHYGYIESLATGQGVPTVGVDLISDETMASFKQTPTLLYRSFPYQPTNTDGNWAGSRQQYEAVHGPTYYAAMVPAYWIGKPFGVHGSLYAVRFATVALVALAVPLTWLLARRLFPDQPVVWLLAPGLLIAVNSLNPGAVSNDAMVLVLSVATILVFLRALDQDRNWVPAAGAGVLFGLTIVTKMTSLVLIPFLALAFLAWFVTQRPKVLSALRFVALFVGGAVVAFGPWLAWNLRTYHATSAAAVVDGITGSTLPSSQLGLSAINQHATVARPGVWLSQLLIGPSYQSLWELTLVAALVLGCVAAALRRRWRDLAVLAWCGAALPLAFLSMEVIVFGLFGGTGGPMGRHLIAALAPTMVMVAGAAVLVVGARWAPPLIAAIVTWSLVLQVPLARTFVDNFYTSTAIDHRLAPVAYQDYAEAAAPDRTVIAVAASCPVEAVGIGFFDTAPGVLPETVVVRSAAGDTTATGIGSVLDIPTYRLAAPVAGPLTIELAPGTWLRSTAQDRDPDLSFSTGAGDPVAAAYCADPDADQIAFARIYPIGHPGRISLAMLRVGPILLAGAAGLVTLALFVSAVRPRRAGASRASEPSPALDA